MSHNVHCQTLGIVTHLFVTAGTGTYSTASGNAASSICPKGWRLPTGKNADGEYYTLYDLYQSVAKLSGANSGPGLVLSSYHGGNVTGEQGVMGYY